MYVFEDAIKKQILSEKELFFLERNIEIIAVLKPVITANRSGQKTSSKKIIKNTRIVDEFQKRIDYLRQVNDRAKQFILDNHGWDDWNNLSK